MNTTRAPSFRAFGSHAISAVPNWPQLPTDLVLDRVVGVGVDSRGFVYVAHRGERPLLCFEPNGRLVGEVGAAHHRKTMAYDLRGPVPVPIATRYWLHGLHVDPWDNVWITDVSRHVVMKFDPTGELKLTLGTDTEAGSDAEHFFQPTHVCVLPSGEVFVTDGYGNSRVAKFDERGHMISEWGRRGTEPGEFHTPHVITLGPNGWLYVSDRENDRIQVFDVDGTLQAVWPGLHSVDGLFAGGDGFLYGCAGIDDALLRFDLAGRLLDVWQQPGLCQYPHAIAVAPDGALYVAETGDRWIVTGSKPEERDILPRTGAEGSRVRKFSGASASLPPSL